MVLPRLAAHAQLSARGGDSLARVIVGKAGSGKSRYLVELRDRLQEGDECELTSQDFGPSLVLVARLAHWLEMRPEVERTEIWRKLWKRAIVRAAASHLLSAESRAGGATPLGDSLRPHIGELLSSSLTPSPISVEFERIMREYPDALGLFEFLDRNEWHEVDRVVGAALAERPRALCYFLDILEEESGHSPLHWLWCLKGLLGQIITFIRDSFGGDKLCVFVAIREQAWVELRNVQPTQLENHPNVRILRWDAPVLLEFFAEKIRLLPEEYRLAEIDPEADPAEVVAAWLGNDRVPNDIRQLEESMGEYILRHTRLVPRDLICVGNFLAGEVFAARYRGESAVADERIRLAVADAARTSAWEALEACALDLIGVWMTGAATRKERQEIMAEEERHRTVARGLGDMLELCSADVVEDVEFEGMAREARTRFGRPVELSQLLWRHGLIGFGPSSEGPFQFSYESRLGGRGTARPPGTHIALHPALIDAVGVAPAGATPVYPFAEDLLCSTRL